MDGFNCGPIACMMLWFQLNPEEAKYKLLEYHQYRCHVVNKLVSMIESLDNSEQIYFTVKIAENINVKERESISRILCDDAYNKNKKKVIVQLDDSDDNDSLRHTICHNIRTDIDNPYLRQRIKHKDKCDEERRHQQDKQAAIMKKRYNQSIETKLGDVVNLNVNRLDRVSYVNRGLIGVVVKLANTGSGAAFIMTKFGILGNQSKEKVMHSPDQYTRIENPTVCHELESVIEEVKKGDYDINKQKVITVSECHRLTYGGNNSCNTRMCGCKKRNSDGNIHCGKNCGCFKNGSLCGSLCKCSETCPNRSSK